MTPLPLFIDTLLDILLRVMGTVGAPGAGLAVFLENLFPPIPSEPVLAAAGIAASNGQLGYVEALVWCTIGSITGAWALYWLGRLLGLERLRRIADKLPLVKVTDIDRTQAWFDRHGSKAVFFGRMVPLFRSFISIPAGVTKMPFWKFSLLTALGSGIWNTGFISAGFFLGENWHAIEPVMDVLQYVILAAIGVWAVWFVVTRIRERRARTEANTGAHDPVLADLEGSIGESPASPGSPSDDDPHRATDPLSSGRQRDDDPR